MCNVLLNKKFKMQWQNSLLNVWRFAYFFLNNITLYIFIIIQYTKKYSIVKVLFIIFITKFDKKYSISSLLFFFKANFDLTAC